MSKRDHATISQGARPERPDPDAISRRAYELFLQRGSGREQDRQGDELGDWLQAEAELTALASGPHADNGVALEATGTDEPAAAGPAQPDKAPSGRIDTETPGSEQSRADRDRGVGRRSARHQPNH